MNIFEITVQRKTGTTWPIVVEQSAVGAFLTVRTECVLQVEMAGFQSQLIAQHTPRDYGTLLGKALFRDEVRDAFVQALSKSDDRLHVLLFVEDTELRVLRWERLCAPLDGDWHFLAQNQRVPFSLYLPSVTDRRFPPIGRRDLRALIVVVNPEGLDQYRLAPIDEAATVSSVRAALGEIPSDVLAVGDGKSTLDSLCDRITAEQYTLLHLVGHGRFALDDGELTLFLAAADKRVEAVKATHFLNRLKQVRGARGLPHFAFLCTCDSASPEAEGSLGGLAQRLVRDLGMPAVVAMTEKVSIATAQALAHAFYRQLREHGEVDRALVEACARLADRHDAIVPALYSRLGGRPLFSDALNRSLTNQEIAHGLTRMKELLPDRAPVLLQGFEAHAAILQGTIGASADALSPTLQQERTKALSEIQRICEESLDLSFPALALDHEPPVYYDKRCPFQGLLAFHYESRDFFFGREVLIHCLQSKLANHHFLAVLGPSGSGKSSLVLAGLIPALQAKQPGLATAYLTPGNDPHVQLDTCLANLRDSEGVLVVDQFEELFTICPNMEQRRTFLARLLQLPETTKVVVTMRADFWGECAPYAALKDRMQSHQELVPPMDAVELRRAMEAQASKVGLRFEADLTNTILDDVAGEPGAMPLMQHALLELWKRRHGRWLRAEEYRALGGVTKAIAETAERVYRELTVNDQERARDIFLRLTRLDQEAFRAEDRRDTRQRAGLHELTPSGSKPADTKALVKRLGDARLIVTSVNAVTGREEIEVVHEALIRYWPRLSGWLDENRAHLVLLASVRLAAQEWQNNRTNESLLIHHGSRLIDAERLLLDARRRLNQEETGYLVACQSQQVRQAHRERRNQRWIVGVSVAAAVIASGFTVWALVERHEAKSALTRETKALGESRDSLRQAARIALGQGVAYYDQGDSQRGLLWYSRASELAERANDEELKSSVMMFLTGGSNQMITVDTVVPRETRTNAGAVKPYGGSVGQDDWAVTIDPISQLIVTRSSDRKVRLWDVAKGKQELDSRLDGDGTRSVAFSHDGKTIAIARENGVQLWDLNSKQLKSLPDQAANAKTMGMAFSSNDKFLAAVTTVGTRVWSATTGKLHALSRLVAPVEQRIAVSPDGKTIAFSTSAGVELWDTSTDKVAQTLQGHSSNVNDIAFSSDGLGIATVSHDRTARLWRKDTKDDEKWSLQDIFVGHTDHVNGVAFSPDCKILATVSRDGTVRLWDTWFAATSKQRHLLQGHAGAAYALAFSVDGMKIVSAGDDGVRVWNLESKKDADVGPAREGRRLTFNSDDKVLFHDGNGLRWDWAVAPQLQESVKDSRRVAVSPNGRIMATVSNDKSVRVWDVRSGELVRTLPLQTLHGKIAFSPDNGTLASASEAGVCLWSITTGEATWLSKNGSSEATAVAFSPNGRTVGVAFYYDEIARLWRQDGGRWEGQELHGHTMSVRDLKFSPDGETVATASSDRSARLWEIATGKQIHLLDGDRNLVNRVAFSPDGKRVATACNDGTIRIWVAATGRQIQRIQGNVTEVSALAFSLPNGNELAIQGMGLQLLDLSILKAAKPERIKRWTEVITGLNLTENGAIRVLDAAGWATRRQQLEELGGPPEP